MRDQQPAIDQYLAQRLPGRPEVHSLGVGAGSGILAGVCCLGSAIAVGAGIGGLSFFSTWMDRYQPFFVAAGVVAMLLSLARLWRRHDLPGRTRGQVAHIMLRHAVAMGLVFGLTLAFATGTAAATGAL